MTSTSLQCEYCDKTLSSVSSLNLHLKTNKACIQIREENNIPVEKIVFECKSCKTSFTSKQNLDKHLKGGCDGSDEIEITVNSDSSDDESKDKKSDKKSNNRLDLSEDNVEKCLGSAFDLKISVSDGEVEDEDANPATRGEFDRCIRLIYSWIVKKLLTNENGTVIYKLADKSRYKFTYIDHDGKKVTDQNAEKLMDAVAEHLKTIVGKRILKEHKLVTKTYNIYLDEKEGEIYEKGLEDEEKKDEEWKLRCQEDYKKELLERYLLPVNKNFIKESFEEYYAEKVKGYGHPERKDKIEYQEPEHAGHDSEKILEQKSKRIKLNKKIWILEEFLKFEKFYIKMAKVL